MARGAKYQELFDQLERVGVSGSSTPLPSKPGQENTTTAAYTHISSSIPRSTASVATRRPTATSVSSWQSSNDRNTLSRTSSVSSSTSRPPWEPPEEFDRHFQRLAMAPYDYGYDLPCEFGFLGCNLRFSPEYHDDWVSHSASHFSTHPLPPKAVCTLCDWEFDSAASGIDPRANWTQRSDHIGSHFYESRRAGNHETSHTKPDFFVLDYMRDKNLLSKEDYLELTKYTERPHCENLYSLGYQTPEMESRNQKEERQARQTDDLDRERRIMRRGKVPKERRCAPAISRREVKLLPTDR